MTTGGLRKLTIAKTIIGVRKSYGNFLVVRRGKPLVSLTITNFPFVLHARLQITYAPKIASDYQYASLSLATSDYQYASLPLATTLLLLVATNLLLSGFPVTTWLRFMIFLLSVLIVSFLINYVNITFKLHTQSHYTPWNVLSLVYPAFIPNN